MLALPAVPAVAQSTGGQPPGGPSASGAPGAPPDGGGGGGSGGDSAGLPDTASATYQQSGGTATKTGEAIAASEADQSAVWVTDGGSLTLTDATITSTGDTSSADASSFYGLDAAVLADDGSSITMAGGSITTTGTGANGAFASGDGSSVSLTGTTIAATGDAAHGVMATQGGSASLTDVTIDTTGAHAAPIATDRGSGTITVQGGTFTSSGDGSPGIYSTGAITADGIVVAATGSETAVIEGANSITLTDSSLTTSVEDLRGVMIYQSMSGDAEGTDGTFTMTGGSLASTADTGPLFYVTNATGIITLTDVDVTAGSGVLVQAAADSWGTTGSNGGHAVVTASGETLTGDLVADDISSISLMLTDASTWTGAADSAAISLDATSSWVVTADSVLTTLSDQGGVSGSTITNITGNGHTVTYDASLDGNAWLAGGTYTLSGGGTLTPAS
ncbi:MAG: hypothetical protein U0667_09340 [Chloroflexota bacterium]